MPDEISRSERSEHDPVNASQLPGKLIVGDFHELTPLRLAEGVLGCEFQAQCLPLGLLERCNGRGRLS